MGLWLARGFHSTATTANIFAISILKPIVNCLYVTRKTNKLEWIINEYKKYNNNFFYTSDAIYEILYIFNTSLVFSIMLIYSLNLKFVCMTKLTDPNLSANDTGFYK